MVKVLNHFCIVSLGTLLLVGCTDNGLLFRSFGTYEKDENAITYKVDKPYQIKDTWYTPKEDYTYSETGIAGWYQEENGSLTSNGEKYDDSVMSAMHKTLPLPSMVRITNLENGNVAIVRVNERGPYVNNRLIDVSQKTAEALEFNLLETTMVKVEILPDESRRLKQEIVKNANITPETSFNESSAISSVVQIDSLNETPQPLYQPSDADTILYSSTLRNEEANQHNNFSGISSITKPLEATTSAGIVTSHTITQSDASSISPLSQKNLPEPQLLTPISGHYIQAGAFSNAQNAEMLKKSLEEFGPVQLYKTSVNDKTLLRVRMGPFETEKSAQELLEKLKTAGYNQAKIIYEP